MHLIAYAELDLFGSLILLLFLVNQRRSGSFSLDDRLFNGILIAAIVEQVMDAGQWLLDGTSFPGAYVLQMVCYSLGYGVAPVITCLWAMYCDLRVHVDERGLKKRAALYAIPVMLNTLLLIANLFTPLVFRIDEAHIYHREQWFLVYMVLMYFYGLLSMVLVLRKAARTESALEKRELHYMALFVVPPVIGGAVQWMFYGVSIIWVTVAFSIILIYINVLSRQISTDVLTGLNNRRKLNRYLDLKINSAEADAATFLMMIDADHFKSINDNFGHAAGDRALVAISDILKSLCSNRDCFLARLGGDEFLIVGEDQDDRGPDALTREISAQVDAFNQSGAEPFPLSLSIGIAHFDPERVNTVDALLVAADQAMYRVKAAKKDASHRAKLFRPKD